MKTGTEWAERAKCTFYSEKCVFAQRWDRPLHNRARGWSLARSGAAAPWTRRFWQTVLPAPTPQQSRPKGRGRQGALMPPQDRPTVPPVPLSSVTTGAPGAPTPRPLHPLPPAPGTPILQHQQDDEPTPWFPPVLTPRSLH